MANRNEKGITLILGTLSLVFIIPVIGLAIDVGFLYAVQSKLQAAVDGASLAAARSLNEGQSTTAQASSAQANAVNWFWATFPSGYFGTSATTMGTSNVVVVDDPNNAHLRDVTVTATTQVDTFFMKWFGVGYTTMGATGTASRRDVVVMMVLDRSGSMCAGGSVPCTKSQTTLPCAQMISAAKIFTGQFAEGRDQIGLISFSDNAYIHYTPTTNFQTDLGYTNDGGSGTGALDSIACEGGTGTAEGLAMAYQTLYQTNLQGALNLILLETDGLPNTLTMNFYDSANNLVGLNNSSSSTCQDTSGKTLKNGGFGSASVIPNWTSGLSLTTSPFLTSAGYYSSIPAGMVGAVASTDPSGGNAFFLMLKYFTTTTGTAGDPYNSTTYLTNSTAPGCAFDSTNVSTNPADIAWFPATDAFGNQMNPSGYTYQSVTTDAKGHITQNGWSNFHNAVLNATDNAAYQARANATLPVYFFTIGLGGNSAVPPDPVLLQRIANDPNGDTFNNPATYQPCASEANCVTYSTQPQGTFIYSSNSTYLAQAFLRISSQVLRMSK